MAKKVYDIAVIGAGSAGIVAADILAQAGKKVALIEKQDLGGDCFNSGCISSKILLKTAHLSEKIKNSSQLGLYCSLGKFDLSKIMNSVNETANQVKQQYKNKILKNKNINFIEEEAFLNSKNSLLAGKNEILFKKMLISCGSLPYEPNIPGLKTSGFMTSSSVFKADKLPKTLAVIGGGSIGLELGQSFQNLGSQVFIIDRGNGPFFKNDKDITKLMIEHLQKEGMRFFTDSCVNKIKKIKNGLTIEILQGKKTKEIQTDALIVAAGRKPDLNFLKLKKTNLKINGKGFIQTNSFMQTNIPHIYAAGDVTGPYLFAHMAVYQARIAAANILNGNKIKADYSLVPWTTYTSPEVAHVGLNEYQAKEKKVFKRQITIDLKNVDRAISENDTKGFLKLILGKNDKILGVTIVGQKAGEMIGMGVLSINKKFSAQNFAGMILPYPTVSEVYNLACLYSKKTG